MQAEAIEFKQFYSLLDDTCEQRIVAAKAALGKRARKIVNQIKVPEAEAKLALERILEVS